MGGGPGTGFAEVKCDASCFSRSFAPTMMIEVVNMQGAGNGRQLYQETAEAFRTAMELPMPRCGEGSV
jgi:hypothetical protein